MIRCGSFGDGLQASSPIAELKRAGYRVTVMCSAQIEQVLRHDPNIDEFIIQPAIWDKGDYHAWLKTIEAEYDHIANLSEAVEGDLAAQPIYYNYYRPLKVRQATLGTVNYVEHGHALAGVPFTVSRQWFHETGPELAVAWQAIKGAPSLGIALCGSHDYKRWPHVAAFAAEMAKATPGLRIFLFGAFEGRDKKIEQDIIAAVDAAVGEENSHIVSMLGAPMRNSMMLACIVDTLIGPDTAVMNAAALRWNRKVVLLTHNTATNLTRDWVNTIAINGRAPCAPCLRLNHMDGDCPRVLGIAACAETITVDEVLAAVSAKASSFRSVA